MHSNPPLVNPSLVPKPRHSRGFSLVEVALALGIVAFAFVSLFGLLPVGLGVFRTAIDVGNETWIMQGLNSMIQVTEWSKIVGPNSELKNEVFYYNEEGRLTDTKSNPSSNTKVVASRLYAVKVLIDDFYRPNDSKNQMPNTVRVVALFAAVANPTAMKDFDGTTTVAAAATLKSSSQVRSRAFLVARMDSEKQ